MVKVACMLRNRGVQLILAYSWARPAILVAGRSRGRKLQVSFCDRLSSVRPLAFHIFNNS